MIKGQVVYGGFDELIIRKKADVSVEIGELLICDVDNKKILLQIYDLRYSSQLSEQTLEMIAGLQIEEQTNVELFDNNERNYVLISAKPLLLLDGGKMMHCKILPQMLTPVRSVEQADLDGLVAETNNALWLGNLRSGSKELGIKAELPCSEVFSHHVLVAGTTGKGKSYFVKHLLSQLLKGKGVGGLIFDPHDEYYGRSGSGLKDIDQDNVIYYTPKASVAGSLSLRMSVSLLRPEHFMGIIALSQPQIDCLYAYYHYYGASWVEQLMLKDEISKKYSIRIETLSVVRRKLSILLGISAHEQSLRAEGMFALGDEVGVSLVKDMIRSLEKEKLVIIDTSVLPGQVELLIASLITHEVLKTYKRYSYQGQLQEKPVISVVLEEAPRVLRENMQSIFSTVAKEGRKFKIGLTAITQMPSLIPKEILSNMNTKVILGLEMGNERNAIIESSAQDLRKESKMIASLDRGEAIISSSFSKFAYPISIPSHDSTRKADNASVRVRGF